MFHLLPTLTNKSAVISQPGTPNAAWLLQCHALSGANGVVGGEVPVSRQPSQGTRKHIPLTNREVGKHHRLKLMPSRKNVQFFSRKWIFVHLSSPKSPKIPSLPSPVQLLVPFAAPSNVEEVGGLLGRPVLSQSEVFKLDPKLKDYEFHHSVPSLKLT